MTDLVHRRLRTPGAAQYVGYSESTLEKKRLTGDGPPFIRLGRAVVYDTRDLDAWLAQCICRSTSEADEKARREVGTPSIRRVRSPKMPDRRETLAETSAHRHARPPSSIPCGIVRPKKSRIFRRA